jgi:hypothetical protein
VISLYVISIYVRDRRPARTAPGRMEDVMGWAPPAPVAGWRLEKYLLPAHETPALNFVLQVH